MEALDRADDGGLREVRVQSQRPLLELRVCVPTQGMSVCLLRCQVKTYRVQVVMAEDSRPMKDAVFLDVEMDADSAMEAHELVVRKFGGEHPELHSERMKFRISETETYKQTPEM